MKKAVDIPLWAKVGSIVWVEVRDKSEQEILEYLEGVVTVADHENKNLLVKIGDDERKVRGDLLLERLESHQIVNDLSDIPILNDAELLKHLEVRYKNDLIHCYCGPTLVVINPYKNIPKESSNEKKINIVLHYTEKTLKKADPHVWTISAIAYDSLFTMDSNQAICISGESGAGKTECTKKCLEFITNLKNERKSLTYVPIESKIMACNPLLESFGNSKTFRNDNSSRFGKYTVLYIDKQRKSVKGASIENYLLEKSRICSLAKEERNYHIFYAMCRFMPKDKQAKYELLNSNGRCDMKLFNYLNQSSIYEHPKINDEEFYEEVCNSFKDLNFTAEQEDAIWRILATVLYIGNLEIDDSRYEDGKIGCSIKPSLAWEKVLKLLSIESKVLEEGLSMKEMKIAGTFSKIPLTPSRTKNSIDTIAKELYNRSFNWIVKKLNKSLLPKNINEANYGIIGVLDIFGFEIFDKNSIEQIFINYANERLQSLYIDYIFKNECRIFEEEGLGAYTANIKYKDNRPLVLALDNSKMPPGVFDLIDQTCLLSKNDQNLHSDIMKEHLNSQHISFPKFAKTLSFVVKHTARDVEYITDGFVEKNKDELSLFLKKAIETGNKEIVGIFNETSGLDVVKDSDVALKPNPKEKYLGFKFRKNMNELINQLSICYCHFIRCLKPNEQKKSDFWVSTLALIQIKYMGLLDSLKVRKMSYPFRFEYNKFFRIYQDLDMGVDSVQPYQYFENQNSDFILLSKELLKNCEVPFTESDLLYGKTKIFLNEKIKISLDKVLMIKQKKKKDGLNLIRQMYLNYSTKINIVEYFQQTSKGINLSRDLVRSWTAKLEGMNFRQYIKIVKKIQYKHRRKNNFRERRFKALTMEKVMLFLGLVKVWRVFNHVLDFKRKVVTLQAMMNRSLLDSKNRKCRAVLTKVFEISWIEIQKRIQKKSIQTLQNALRSHFLRKNQKSQLTLLKKKIVEAKTQNAAIQIQKVYKGFKVRKMIALKNIAASKIQRFFQTKWLRSYFIQIRKSVPKIQNVFRMFSLRKKQIKASMEEFLKENKQIPELISNIEHSILFDSNFSIQEIQKVFKNSNIQEKDLDNFCNSSYFIPSQPAVEVNPKAKLFSVLIDVDAQSDTSIIYKNTWSFEFGKLIKKLRTKGSRLLHLDIGDSFTTAISDDKEIYTWGLNDYGQCARIGGFSLGEGLVKNLSLIPTKQISIGNDHGTIIDESNNLFLWGKNLNGELGVKNNQGYIVSSQLKDSKLIQSKEGQNFLLNNEGKVCTWPNLNSNLDILVPQFLDFPKDVKISTIDCGSEFVVFLSNNGQLFSVGSNQNGQLGQGHLNDTYSVGLVKTFKDLNQKIIEVSCGFKHVICRTALNRIFTWGFNSNGQLGQNDLQDRAIPTLLTIESKTIRPKVRSVQAGLLHSLILLDDRQLFYSGRINSNKIAAKVPSMFSYEEKLSEKRMVQDFTPLKVYSKWSKNINVIYILFVDFRNCSQPNNLREKFVEKINQIWSDCDRQILPPSDDLIIKHLGSKYVQKQPKFPKQNLNYSSVVYQTHEQDNIYSSVVDQIQEDQKAPNSKINKDQINLKEVILKIEQKNLKIQKDMKDNKDNQNKSLIEKKDIKNEVEKETIQGLKRALEKSNQKNQTALKNGQKEASQKIDLSKSREKKQNKQFDLIQCVFI